MTEADLAAAFLFSSESMYSKFTLKAAYFVPARLVESGSTLATVTLM